MLIGSIVLLEAVTVSQLLMGEGGSDYFHRCIRVSIDL